MAALVSQPNPYDEMRYRRAAVLHATGALPRPLDEGPTRVSARSRAAQLAGWAAFVAVLAWAATRRPDARPTDAPGGAAQRTSAAALASLTWRPPPGARGLLVLDLERLRTLPSLAPFLTGAAPEAPCELRALAQARTAAVVFDAPSLDEGAVALTGPVDDAALLACAYESDAGAPAVRAGSYRGLALRRTLPPVARSLVRVDPSLAVYGSHAMVQRVLDHQTAPGGPVGDEALEALLELAPPASAPPALLLALRGNPSRWAPGNGARAFRGVTGVLLRAVFDREGTDVRAVFACDDFDAPAVVRDALALALRDLGARAPDGPLRALIAQVRVERGATHVSAHVRLSRSDTELFVALLPTFAAGESPTSE